MTAITLSNINKRFGEKVLFRDYSLHIEAGEFVSIKGESGAGKTTLLNIIGLLETPDSGSVTLCGARNPSFSSRAAVHLRSSAACSAPQSGRPADASERRKTLAYAGVLDALAVSVSSFTPVSDAAIF